MLSIIGPNLNNNQLIISRFVSALKSQSATLSQSLQNLWMQQCVSNVTWRLRTTRRSAQRRCVWCRSYDLPCHHLLLSMDVSPVAAITLVSRPYAAAWLRKPKKKRRLSAASQSPWCHRADVSDAWFFCLRSQTGQRRWRDTNYPGNSVQLEDTYRFLGKWTILSCSSDTTLHRTGSPTMFVFVFVSSFSRGKIIYDKDCRYSSWRCLLGFLDADGKLTNALCCRCRRSQTCSTEWTR